MLRRLINHARNKRGQSLVEFALVLPVFLAIVFGMIDFGNVLYQREILAEATRRAGRAVSLLPSDTTSTSVAKAAADKEIKPFVNNNDYNIKVSNGSKKGEMTIATTVEIPLLTPMTKFIFHNESCPVKCSATVWLVGASNPSGRNLPEPEPDNPPPPASSTSSTTSSSTSSSTSASSSGSSSSGCGSSGSSTSNSSTGSSTSTSSTSSSSTSSTSSSSGNINL